MKSELGFDELCGSDAPFLVDDLFVWVRRALGVPWFEIFRRWSEGDTSVSLDWLCLLCRPNRRRDCILN